MERMNTPTNASRKPGIGQILGAAAVALGGTLAAVYALNRLRRHSKTQALLDTLPPTTDVGIEDNTAEPADDIYDPAEVTHGHGSVKRLKDLRFDELYQLAQQHDVVGRSSMRKAELVAALRDVQTNPEIG